jgi:hypothetical protein
MPSRRLSLALFAAAAALSFAVAWPLRTRDLHGRPRVVTQTMPRPGVPQMDGVWALRMVVDSTHGGVDVAVGDSLAATVVIDGRIPPAAEDGMAGADPAQFAEMQVRMPPSRTGPGAYDLALVAVLSRGDTVHLVHPVSHGCRYRIAVAGDAGTGDYACDGYSGWHRGRLAARRRDDDGGAARAVSRAWTRFQQELALGDPWVDELGWLRVRVIDRRTGRPLAASVRVGGYPVAAAAADGFGPYLLVPAGVHYLEITSFACGTRMLSADQARGSGARPQVAVARWRRAEATLEVDPTRIPVAPSRGNPRGEPCAR